MLVAEQKSNVHKNGQYTLNQIGSSGIYIGISERPTRPGPPSSSIVMWIQEHGNSQEETSPACRPGNQTATMREMPTAERASQRDGTAR